MNAPVDLEAIALLVDMRRPAAPPDVRCELIEEYLAEAAKAGTP